MALELNHIYCGDCLDLIREIPDKSIDLVLTDPPHSEVTHAGMRATTDKGIVSSIDFSSVTFQELQEVYGEIARVSKRWVISFMDWRHIAKFEEIGVPGLDFVRFGVWYKPNAMRQVSADRPATGWEGLCFLHKSDEKKVWNGGGRLGVFVHDNVRSGRFYANYHPTEKPVGLIQEFLDLFSCTGDTILDPFLGSGTTAVACVRTGRNYIGIEKEPKYVEIALKRLEKVNNHKISDFGVCAPV